MTGIGDYFPTLADLASEDLDGRTVAISREILADLDTPVSAYLKVRQSGPSFLLESVEGGERIGRYSFIGSKARRTVRVRDGFAKFDSGDRFKVPDPLNLIKSMVDAYAPAQPPLARFEGGVVGYLGYESARYFERLPTASSDPLGMPDAAFMDIDTVLVFDHVAHKIRIVSHVWLNRPLPVAYAEAVDRIEELAQELEGQLLNPEVLVSRAGSFQSNMEPDTYKAMVESVKTHIAAGDILQAVVSQRLSLPISGDPFALYRRLRAVSPSPFMYYLDFLDHQLVGASPELLLQVEGDVVTTRPIAGTRRRGETLAEDAALAKDLLADEKERAEHLMLVDLARNDVGRVSRPGTVEVTQFMGVERFSHVMHLVSDVVGRLRDDCDVYRALRAAFPAGTVSGAPKIRAMKIIAELERDRRGPYAGAVGFVNTMSNLEMAIAIRTGVVVSGNLHVQAGAGIVADSVPEHEFEETLSKARALLIAAGAET